MCLEGSTPPLAYDTLKAALKRAEKVAPTLCADGKLIILAAEAHLTTLPKPAPKQYRVLYFFIEEYPKTDLAAAQNAQQAQTMASQSDIVDRLYMLVNDADSGLAVRHVCRAAAEKIKELRSGAVKIS